jgi:hypothetical protein
MKQMVNQMDVREHPMVQALAVIISEIEHKQAQAVARNIKAADLDLPLAHDVEQRRETLLDVAEAVAEEDLERLWFEELADIENPTMAREYIGMHGDEWRNQIRQWYAKYHELDIVDETLEDADERDLGHVVGMHIEQTFEVDVETFVAGVINWQQREALRHLLAGNIEAHTEVMHRVADEIEDLQDERDRLQERVDELEDQLEDK